MRAGLSEADADADPLRQFERWFDDALRAKLPLPNAMTLATVSPRARPSARIVLLKGVEGGGFVFYTNYRSRKGRELAARPQACLVFLWSDLERQVRIDGARGAGRRRRRPTPTTPPARSARATRPGPRRRAKRCRPRRPRGGACEEMARRHGEQPAAPAALGRLPRRARRRSSSGRDAPTACTTGCSTAAHGEQAGPLSASLPEPVLRFLRGAALAAPDESPAATRSPAACPPTSGASTCARAGVRQARAAAPARGAGLGSAGRAQPLRVGAGCESPARGRARRAPRVARRTTTAGCSPWSTSSAPVWKARAARRATPTRPSPRQVGAALAAHPCRHRRRATRSRAASPPTPSSTPSASSPICSPPARAHPALARAAAGARQSAPARQRVAWCTATSARRTSWSGRTGRCSSTPSAPGTATRRSTSPSASTTCF